MSSGITTINIGKHEEIPVYPQKWAYLANRTSKTIMGVFSGAEETLDAAGTDGAVNWMGDSTYELLVAMIPTVGKRMPLYQFKGYGSQEAMDNGDYDEDSDDSPTVPEIINAFEVAIKVNRFDLAKILTNLIDVGKIKSTITERINRAISENSQNSQQQNGTFPSTTTGTTLRTSTEKEESLSLD